MAGYLFAMGSKEAAMKCMRTGIYSTYVKPTWNYDKILAFFEEKNEWIIQCRNASRGWITRAAQQARIHSRAGVRQMGLFISSSRRISNEASTIHGLY